MGESVGAVTTLMIGTTVANGWGTGEGTGEGTGGGGGETIVGTTPTGIGRGEGEDTTTTVGMVTGRDCDGEGTFTKETVDGVTLG